MAFFSRRLLLGVLLSTATAVAADDPYARLVKQLGDADPAVRQAAHDALAKAPEAARAALRIAAHSRRPAIAAAASELLMQGNWYLESDPAPLQTRLGVYGSLNTAQRTNVLKTLVTNIDVGRVARKVPPIKLGGELPIGVLSKPVVPDNVESIWYAAALRVAQEEPADEVVWGAFNGLALNEKWQALLDDKNAGRIPPAILLARGQTVLTGIMQLAASSEMDSAPREPHIVYRSAEQRDVGLGLLRRGLEQERDNPTGTSENLAWAASVLSAADVDSGRPDRGAQWLRLLANRGDGMNSEAEDQFPDRVTPAMEVLGLQARFGPLPRLVDDLSSATGDDAAITLAAITRRLGDPITSAALLFHVTADHPGEADADKAGRLQRLGDALARARLMDAAQDAFQRAIATEQLSSEAAVAVYMKIYAIQLAAGQTQDAADSLQRALDHGSPLRPDGEPWPREDLRGRIAVLSMQAASKRGDWDRVREQAKILLQSGSTDSEVFLDALPLLQSGAPVVTPPDVVDVYFNRVYAVTAARLAQQPGNPMEMNNVAWLCSRSARRLDEALKLGQQAVDTMPEAPEYLDTLADIKFQTGAAAEAVSLEQRALKVMPDDSFMKGQLERFKKGATTQP